jgi:hypothetical protein
MVVNPSTPPLHDICVYKSGDGLLPNEFKGGVGL